MKQSKIALTILIIFCFSFSTSALAAPALTVTGSDEQKTISAIKKILPAVVSITVSGMQNIATFDKQGNLATSSNIKSQLAAGTGFLVTADGLIVTNKHVVDFQALDLSYRITLTSGKRYYAQLIGTDPVNDLAILKIHENKLPFVELGDNHRLQLGQSVIAIGNALGVYKNSVTKGIVSGLNRSILAYDGLSSTESLSNIIQTDAQINPGNSGGPLIDLNGKVVGVNVALDEGGQSLGFAIPINDVKPIITSAKKDLRIIRPRLGIAFLDINQDVIDQFNLPVNYGAYIRGVGTSTPGVALGSPAAKAGLLEGDIIMEIDGRKLENVSLLEIMNRYKPGQKIGLKIRRGNRTFSQIVILGSF
jgi:S1-C subfamily serine protease